MKFLLTIAAICLSGLITGSAYGHFTGVGHVHTHSESRQTFQNTDCRLTDSCDLKRFSLTTAINEIWFSDDPIHPTYANGVIMEYETDRVEALERYAVVQFVKGCVYQTAKDADGQITSNIGDTIMSFGEYVPFCFRNWVIDSQDTDPVYNSDPQYGRIYLARWNQPGSYDNRTQKFFGMEKPRRPVVYMTDYPAGAFVTGTGVRNTALEFNTCIYKASDVPAASRREDIHFAKPLNCFAWRDIYVYDYATAVFRTDSAALPNFAQPSAPVNSLRVVIFFAVLLVLIYFSFLIQRKFRGRIARD
jgi:hypothetical protein